ncbi:MAG: hypothetical protein ABIE70_10360 [bacterium]
MSFSFSRLLGVAAMAVVAVLYFAIASSAQTPELTIDLTDTIAPENQSGVLTIRMSNYQDTVAGYSLWLQLDRPDLILFRYDTTTITDTTYWQCLQWIDFDCIDSQLVTSADPWDFIHIDSSQAQVAEVDTVGTLTSGWQYVGARTLSGVGTDVKITALSDMIGLPFVPGIPPQQGGDLIRLPFDILDYPDTLSDCTVHVMVNRYDATQFCFSTPQGQCIGWNQVQYPDTTFFQCNYWVGDVCLNWTVVPSGQPYDSLYVEYVTEMILDTTAVVVQEIDINLCEPPLFIGDFDCGGSLNIVDLVALVNFMFNGGPPSACPWNLDCDGNGVGPDIADLVCLVTWMFPPR